MPIDRVRINGVRNLRNQEIDPGAGLNLFHGPNGAGKTSILEALHCVATGRSFRGGQPLAWLDRGSGRAEIYLEIEGHRLGLAQERGNWVGRVDGQSVSSRAELSIHLPLFVFHPESHAIIGGTPDNRRRLVDLGVFHVEPSFLDAWREYRRAQKQRNAALKQGNSEQLDSWEAAMTRAAAHVTEARRRYVSRLAEAMETFVAALELRIPRLSLGWYAGWPEDTSLDEALRRSRAGDLERGFTTPGAHRGDLRIRDEGGLVASRLSRGQEKIAALCLIVAQAQVYADDQGHSPIVAIDDMGSELDVEHQSTLGDWLTGQPWQVWITGLEVPEWIRGIKNAGLFHVEQGSIRAMV